MVREARKVDMDEVYKHKVYEKVPLEECYKERGVAPIGIRWVDTNKGDRVHPEYRSILVAQEINVNKRRSVCRHASAGSEEDIVLQASYVGQCNNVHACHSHMHDRGECMSDMGGCRDMVLCTALRSCALC